MYYVFAAEAWDRPGQIVLEICFAESATALTAWIHQLENDYDGGLTTLTFLFMSDWSSLRVVGGLSFFVGEAHPLLVIQSNPHSDQTRADISIFVRITSRSSVACACYPTRRGLECVS
jgi:hypothetical protein